MLIFQVQTQQKIKSFLINQYDLIKIEFTLFCSNDLIEIRNSGILKYNFLIIALIFGTNLTF